jgi:hypothetical protein
MADLELGARLHRKRAEQFRANADATRCPDTRDLYLRLAETEEALAERMERLFKQKSSDSRNAQQSRASRSAAG